MKIAVFIVRYMNKSEKSPSVCHISIQILFSIFDHHPLRETMNSSDAGNPWVMMKYLFFQFFIYNHFLFL